MMEPIVPRLLFSISLWSDESIINSFQVRAREANGVGSLEQLAAVAQFPRGSFSALRLLTDPQITDALGRMAGLDVELSTSTPKPLLGANGYELRWERGALSVQFWMHSRSQVCPACLTSKGYLPESLDYWHLPVCTEHQLMLVDVCDSCGKFISPSRPALCFCSHCGFDFRLSKQNTVPEQVNRLSQRLSTLTDIPLRTSSEAVNLDASRIAALCAYFATGEPFPAWSEKLPALLEELPAGRRLAGLTSLAQCFDGREFVAQRVKSAFVAMCEFIQPFLDSAVFEYWMNRSMVAMELGQRVVNSIALDVPSDVAHFALHHAGGEQYRVANDASFASLLGCSLYELEELRRIHQFHKGASDDYYDADLVMRVSNYFQAILDEHTLDNLFGAFGVTRLLRQHQLLTGFASKEACFIRVTPDSVLGLLEKVQRDTKLSLGSYDEATKKQAPDAEAVAKNVITLLHKSAKSALWRAPYRLADLVVVPSAQ